MKAGKQTGRHPVRFWLILAAIIIALFLISHIKMALAGPFLEKDFIWLTAGRIGAQYLQYSDHLIDLFSKPIMIAVDDARPGQWMLHVLIGAAFEDNPTPVLLVIMAAGILNALLAAFLAYRLFASKSIAAAVSLLYAVHPQMVGFGASITALSAQAAMFWMLMGFISFLRFKRIGHPYQLIPVICCVFLSYATHPLGIVSWAGLLFLDIATAPRGKTGQAIAGIAARALIFIMPLASFMVMWSTQASKNYFGMIQVTLNSIKAFAIILGQTMQRLLLPWPPSIKQSDLLSGLDIGHMLLFALPVLLGISIAAVYRNRKRIFAFGLMVSGFVFQIPLLITVNIPSGVTSLDAPAILANDPNSPLYAIPFAVMALGLALFIGELIMAMPRKTGAWAALAVLVGIWAVLSNAGAEHWTALGVQVRGMSDKINQIYQASESTDDMIIVGAGRYSEPMLAAHLDFVQRYGINKSARFTFIKRGWLFPGEKGLPTGTSGQRATRWQMDKSMIFLGYGKDGTITDMTPLILEKIDQGTKAMAMTRRTVPGWPFGSERLVERWGMQNDGDNLMPVENPDDLQWYIEGQIYNLHPHVGRFPN